MGRRRCCAARMGPKPFWGPLALFNTVFATGRKGLMQRYKGSIRSLPTPTACSRG